MGSFAIDTETRDSVLEHRLAARRDTGDELGRLADVPKSSIEDDSGCAGGSGVEPI